MNAATFFQIFTDKIYSTSDIISFYWNSESKCFTNTVIPIILEIIRSSGCETSKEYFRIDATGWKTTYQKIQDQAKDIGLNPHLWDLEIAVEHENSKKDWSDEIIKLLHIRCPLKVVIGYNNCKNNARDNGVYSDKRKLALVSEWMERTKAMNQLRKEAGAAVGEEFLVIIGNAGKNPDDSDPRKSFDYRGYRYNYQLRAFEEI